MLAAATFAPTSLEAMNDLSIKLREYHASHDCNPGKCICVCGCQQEMGCRALGGLCSRCHINNNWGEENCGFPSLDAASNEGEKKLSLIHI